MNKVMRAWAYGVLGAVCFGIDRFTKYEALCWCAQQCKLNEYISLEVVYNRGVSWGLFHDTSTALFLAVTGLVALVTLAVLWSAIKRFRDNHLIIGEVLVIAGSLSNLVDRVMYQGVVDFIELSYRGWQWPSFNGADALIVVGVFIMIVEYRKK